MNVKIQKSSLWLFLLALCSSLFFHLANNVMLTEQNPDSLRNGITVKTADDASYLRPVENFLEIGEWKSNLAGKSAYTTRTPGYGLIYFLFRNMMDQRSALVGLVIFQVLLFSFSASLIPKLGRNLDLGSGLSFVIGLLVVLLPMFSGFLSYTLTESITPSLVIICLYLTFTKNHSKAGILILSLLTGYLILVRPAMIIWAILPVFSAFTMKGKHIPSIIFSLLLTFLPIVIWQVHLYQKTGEYQPLHPIYQDDANTMYRPTHKAVWGFHKSWGQGGSEFHKSMTRFSQLARQGLSKQDAVQSIMALIPSRVFQHLNFEDLRSYYSLYFDILGSQAAYLGTQTPIPGLSSEEEQLISHFKEATSIYKAGDFYYSNVVVPVGVFKELTFHSNLSLYIFQGPWRGNFLVEIMRFLCYVLHAGTFLVFLVGIFVLGLNDKYYVILVPVVFYLFYLCFIQRGVEERYTLPVLVPMFLTACKSGQLIIGRIKQLISQ